MPRPALLAFLVVAGLVSLPYLRGVVAPPRGTSFVGGFLSRQDFFNYLGFVQQAEDGRVLLANKLEIAHDRQVMLNPEWWLAGRISALLGRRPLAAFLLVGLAASAALVLALDRWLRLAGLSAGLRARALLLVFLGGGLGGLRYVLLGPPAWRSLDLIAGLFPFIEIVSNPHFVSGTALLCLSVLAFMDGERPRSQWAGVLAGSALALCRPYDVVLLVGIRMVGVMLSERPRLWVRRLLPLAGLLPVALYLYWLFYRSGAFSTFFSGYVSYPAVDLLVALGPAFALALLFWRPRARGLPGQAAEAHLVAWALVGTFLLIARPVGFYFQALVGFGVPLLSLAAIGLARFRPVALLAAAALMSTTTWVALHIFLGDGGQWFVPAERKAAAVALRDVCRQGEIALAPPDIGLLAAAYSPCKPFVSDRYMPAEREEAVTRFYSATDEEWRASFLDRERIAAVILPPGAGETPVDVLGQDTPFRRVRTVGIPPRQLAVYARVAPRERPSAR